MKRREFISKSLAGMAALPLSALYSSPSTSKQLALEAKLTGHETDWTFVGSKDWSQDDAGILYSPVWNHRKTKRPDLLKREDFAYPSAEVLTDTDLSMEFQTFYWSVVTAGIVFRAQDSGRFYAVEIFDMDSKGAQYSVRLYVQDATGYQRDLASCFAPHPPVPDRWVLVGPKPEEWEKATPGWTKARVQAQGNLIRVLVNDQPVIEVRDHTYRAGRAGIVTRGPITFRNLKVVGLPAKPAATWQDVGERPSYFYPWPDPGKQFGDNQTYPGIFRMANGDMGIWMGVTGDPHFPLDILVVWSRDEGKTWGEPMLFKKRADVGKPGYFFGHKDGRLSCMYATTYDWSAKSKGPRVAHSQNGGKTWSDPEPLVVSGKPLYEYAQSGVIGPYSPITRYSDGTLIQYYYQVQTGTGDSPDSALRTRSLVIRSTDDGLTWTGPHYLDPENFDSNETMGVERKDGSIIAFSRTVRAPYMWTSTSPDKGITWSKQVPSNCSGECPFLLRHSSGVLVMGSRSAGVFMKTSIDEGKNWSRETRISLCGGMMGITEMKDGRLLVVFHEAYRTPTRIRGQYMHVHKNGTLSPA